MEGLLTYNWWTGVLIAFASGGGLVMLLRIFKERRKDGAEVDKINADAKKSDAETEVFLSKAASEQIATAMKLVETIEGQMSRVTKMYEKCERNAEEFRDTIDKMVKENSERETNWAKEREAMKFKIVSLEGKVGDMKLALEAFDRQSKRDQKTIDRLSLSIEFCKKEHEKDGTKVVHVKEAEVNVDYGNVNVKKAT